MLKVVETEPLDAVIIHKLNITIIKNCDVSIISHYNYFNLQEGMLEVWRRKVSPIIAGENSFALLFINKEKTKKAVIKFSLMELGLNNTQGYIVTELFSNTSLGVLKANQLINTTVPPMDAIFFSLSVL